MVPSRSFALCAVGRPRAPRGASAGPSRGRTKAPSPGPLAHARQTSPIRQICPESLPFSALLHPPSGSTFAPLATTLGVAFKGPASRTGHRPHGASPTLEKPLVRSGKPVGSFGAQRSFYVDGLGSTWHPRPGLQVPLDKCSLLPGYHQGAHTRSRPLNAVITFTTPPSAATYITTPLRSPQFWVPLTVKKNLTKGTMGKTSQPTPFSLLPHRGLPA
jgi:hypothetical protein